MKTDLDNFHYKSDDSMTERKSRGQPNAALTKRLHECASVAVPGSNIAKHHRRRIETHPWDVIEQLGNKQEPNGGTQIRSIVAACQSRSPNASLASTLGRQCGAYFDLDSYEMGGTVAF